MTLYTALIKAGIQIDSHYSDLYFPVTEQTTAILAKFPKQKEIAKKFICNITKKPCYDVPFAFLPFWEKVPR